MNETDAAPAPPAPTPPRRFGPAGREFWTFVEFFALTGIAITQPLLEALRILAADSVIALGPSRTDILVLCAVVLFAAPVGLWVLEVAIGLALPRGRAALHSALLAALVGVITYVVIGNHTDLSVGALVAFGAIAAILVFRLAQRSEAAHLFLRFLAVAPLVFTVVFLTNHDIAPIAFGPRHTPDADVTVKNPKRIIQIVADEFPTTSLMDGSGHIDRGLFPHIAALADDAHWYRNTTSVAPYTQAAVPAIATGDYPAHPDDLPTARNFPNSLFSLLSGTYSIHAREDASESLCGAASCARSNPTTRRHLIRNARDLWWEFATPGDQSGPKCLCDATTLEDGLPNARRFLNGVRPADGPRLDYLHVLLPHAPWRLHPNGQSYDAGFKVPAGLDLDTLTWTSDSSAIRQRKRHLLQLQALDVYVGRLVERLRAIGAYDDSLIVLTADHGVSFTEGEGYRIPSDVNYHEIMWVPLIMKMPGNTGAGTIDDRPARTIDVMPTIADVVGADIPWRIDGRSLLRAPQSEVDRRFLEWPSGFSFLAPKDAHFERFDEADGFAEVLATPAVNPQLPTGSRVYGYGAAAEFGALIGRRAADLADTSEPPRDVLVTNRRDYEKVNVYADYAPWTLLLGGLDGTEQVPVAVAVNGTIAGITRTIRTEVDSPALRVLLDPQYFVDGVNDVQMYVIRGTPAAPRLVMARRV